MSKVLVDRELLSRIAEHLEWDGTAFKTAAEFAADCDSLIKELMGYIAQPAEAGLQIDQLTAELDRLRELAYIGEHMHEDYSWKARHAELRAEVEALRKDAERYRWLRYADLDALAEANWGLEGEVYQGDEFDRAIDAAMTEKEE